MQMPVAQTAESRARIQVQQFGKCHAESEFLESRSERLQDHFILAARTASCESDADSTRKILIPGPPQQYDGQGQIRIRRGAVPIDRQAAALSEELRDFARMM